jgi:cell division protein FtsB
MNSRKTSADGRFQRVPPSDRRGLTHGRWIATGAITLFLLLVAIFGSGGLMVSRREAREVRDLQADLAQLRAQLDSVHARTEALVEPGGFELERVAREEYMMRAEGEEVIHLVPTPIDAEEQPR